MLHFERITDSTHLMYSNAMALYQKSFPLHEQREVASQTAILSNDAYHFTLLYDEDIFIGILLYWEQPEFLYIEHFCILPELRNHRYGQKALSLLKESQIPFILEIDTPVTPISVRRKGFYERCGFVENPYAHTHPPYHATDNGHELIVMSYPNVLSPSTYDDFSQYLTHTIMQNAFSTL